MKTFEILAECLFPARGIIMREASLQKYWSPLDNPPGKTCLVSGTQVPYLVRGEKTSFCQRRAVIGALVFTLFFSYGAAQCLALAHPHCNGGCKMGDQEGRPLVIRKRCPSPKCCNVVEHMSKTRVKSAKPQLLATAHQFFLDTGSSYKGIRYNPTALQS